MKKVKKAIIRLTLNVALVLGAASLAFANSDVPSIKIMKTGLDKLSLVMEDLSLGTEATVSIEDTKGFVLISEEVKKTNSFAKVFNLKNLPAGDYKMVINTQTRKTIQPITLTEKDITVDVNKRKVIFHPTIRMNESFLDVTWLGNRISDVKVSISNEQGVVVFGDNIKNVFKIEKRYNVAQLERGVYTVRVKTPHDSYYEELVVR